MLKSRRAQRVFGVFLIFSLFCVDAAEAARRRKSRFISLSDPRLSFVLTGKRRFFSRSFVNELLVAPAFVGSPSLSLVSPSLAHSVSAGQILGDRSVVLDASTLEPSGTVRHDQGLPLSSFCSFQCGAVVSISRLFCWVPRDGELAVVPFSVTGSSLCHARQSLCQQIESVGRFPDTLPYICKDLTNDSVLARSEATFNDIGKGVITNHVGSSSCRSGQCGRQHR